MLFRSPKNEQPKNEQPKNEQRDSDGKTRSEREELVKDRPSRYREGVVDKVWENAKQPSDGKVYDPNTGEELSWDRSKTRDGQWDMGHQPGKSYDSLKQRYIDGEITRKEFLNEYNDPKNYHPEDTSSNRSREHDIN